MENAVSVPNLQIRGRQADVPLGRVAAILTKLSRGKGKRTESEMVDQSQMGVRAQRRAAGKHGNKTRTTSLHTCPTPRAWLFGGCRIAWFGDIGQGQRPAGNSFLVPGEQRGHSHEGRWL